MAKGGRPRLWGLDPQGTSQACSGVLWLPGTDRYSIPARAADEGLQLCPALWTRYQPRGQCVTVWLGHSHLGLLNASNPRVSPRFLAEDWDGQGGSTQTP